MRQLLNVFLFVTMLMGLLACEKEEKDMFVVDGERNFSITKEGDTISVILRTTQDYRVTPEGDWCIILEKQPIGFKIQVNENVTVRERENRITIESNIGEPIVLTVKQEAGELFFRMDDAEKSKLFAKEGGTQTVALQTNVENYEVIAPTWCTITEKSNTGFNITAEVNPDILREAKLSVHAQGMEDIEIRVRQSGEPFIKNPYFLDGRNHPGDDSYAAPWVITRTNVTGSNFFILGNYVPSSITLAEHPNRNLYSSIKIDSGYGEGTIFQTVNSIPDGDYTLRFYQYRGSSTTGHLDLVVIDGLGNRKVRNLELNPSGWIEEPVTVVGGKVTIGIEAGRAPGEGMWFHILGFVLE